MKSGGGGAKGAEFERHVCKLLSGWVTSGERSDVFWRSSMSGGRATVSRKKGELLRQSGDITSVAPEGHHLTDKLYFELKFYKNLELMNFFVKHTGTLARFWEKTVEEANSYSKQPVLIVRQDRIPTLLLTQVQVLDPYLSGSVLNRATVFFPGSICMVYHLDEILEIPFRRTTGKRRVRI